MPQSTAALTTQTARLEPAELVRRLLDADAHHDLAGYRALLADEFTEKTEGEVTSRRGDDAAYAAARSWALAPSAYRSVDDISEAPGCVTVRYRLDRAAPVTSTASRRWQNRPAPSRSNHRRRSRSTSPRPGTRAAIACSAD